MQVISSDATAQGSHRGGGSGARPNAGDIASPLLISRGCGTGHIIRASERTDRGDQTIAFPIPASVPKVPAIRRKSWRSTIIEATASHGAELGYHVTLVARCDSSNAEAMHAVLRARHSDDRCCDCRTGQGVDASSSARDFLSWIDDYPVIGASRPTSSCFMSFTRSLTGAMVIPPVYGTSSLLAVWAGPVSQRW